MERCETQLRTREELLHQVANPAVSDLKNVIEDVIVKGDMVVVRVDGLSAITLDLPASRYGEGGLVRLSDALAGAMREIPGVDSVTATTTLPFSGEQASSSFEIEGRAPSPEKQPEANRRNVLPAFWETLEIPLLAGRTFTDSDRSGAPGVVIVSEAMARTRTSEATSA